MLRNYQLAAIDQIRAHYAQGVRKVLLQLSTGGGKTAIFCDILKKAHAKGTTALVVVRGRKLISQAAARLKREGVPYGIIMAGAEANTFERIRICSIDTLYRRRRAPSADLIVIDEAHQTSGEGYKWFLEQYSSARILAVTATPHLKRGLRHVADAVVWPTTAKDLTEAGFLVPLYYWTPETPDLRGVTTTGDDFNQKELGEAMRKAALAGNIVKTYLEKGDGRRAVLFAVDIQHSTQLVGQFREMGVAAEHIDATSTDDERDAAISRLEAGETKVLSNVGVLTTGVDIPAIELVIMARPTKSYNLWIQMVGRGTRPSDGKADCYVFDHAGNVGRHGLLEQERECALDGTPATAPALTKQCEECFAWTSNFATSCPVCGAAFEERVKPERNKEVDEAVELKAYRLPKPAQELDRLVQIAKRKKYKPGFVYHRMKAMFGEQAANTAWLELRRKEASWLAACKQETTKNL